MKMEKMWTQGAYPLADTKGRVPAGVQILLFLCSFQQKMWCLTFFCYSFHRDDRVWMGVYTTNSVDIAKGYLQAE